METTLNQRIKIFAAYKDLGQKELAKAMKVSLNSASLIVNGHSKPRIQTVTNLIEAFEDLNPIWIHTGQGEMLINPGVANRKMGEPKYATQAAMEMLSNEVQMLKQMITQMMGKIENFHTSSLQVGKVLPLITEGAFAGDYQLAS